MLRKIFPLVIGVFTIGLLFNSCKKETQDPFEGIKLQAYYPLEIGHSITYDVDSTFYDDFNCIKYTRRTQLLYTIEDTFTNNEGNLSYITVVRTRADETKFWEPSDVFYVTRTSSGVTTVQQNLTIMKLANPMDEGFVWDGNSRVPAGDQDYDYYQGWDYTYTKADQPFTGEKVNFDRTITVEERDHSINNPDLDPALYAERTTSSAVYAYGIGMVHNEFTHWVYDPVIGCRAGIGIEMHAIEYK